MSSPYAGFRTPPPAFDPGAHPPGRLRCAGRAWTKLRDDEHDSAVAASLVLADLARLNAPAELLGAAARVVEDEVRHVAVCTRVVEAFGLQPEEVPADEMRASLGEGSVVERCRRVLVAGFVVGESLSAATFAEALRRAEEPIARWALKEILRDEANHGGFGLEAATWLLDRFGDRSTAPELWPFCVREMEQMEARVGGPVDAALAREADFRDIDGAEGLGVLRGSASCEAFYRGVERWVLPRLRRLDVVPA